MKVFEEIKAIETKRTKEPLEQNTNVKRGREEEEKWKGIKENVEENEENVEEEEKEEELVVEEQEREENVEEE
ncbi:hypothetical protein M8J76_012687 [Diaphorina citri]|nr:hypothetical protein M8J75_005436 [Diaphorina citri]KAI5709202.1 hypothetical protein M8J76_012687 [Diaphorina citri]